MSEPPTSWDLPEEENSSISLTTTRLAGLNVNVADFVSSFASKSTNVSTSQVPKTPPSTPVVVRHRHENQSNQSKSGTMNTNNIESEDVQQMEEDFTEREQDQFPDDDYDKIMDESNTTPTAATTTATATKKKESVNIVFCGHVDAEKSTIGGQIMFLTGQVDKRTLEKYQNEAREKSRESWYLSWALATNEDEREKGKAVEVGRACHIQ
ncbi:unnamed protein product [Rotaria sordida]|uniref:Tr-type G domain-containing protein n=1 Tax=Rotaria sordida TaxID=392033 RepID=A0A814BH26_9BILA|nr:unnamed protein product [Rotaria sordida]